SEYSHGWKEYLCIMVKNDKIVYAEFNAKNSSGYIKSWDNAYMENMGTVSGTYPNEYTRYYVAQLIESQSPEGVDILTGASSSGNNFSKLSTAVINQAVAGNPDVALVE
ncbi:MAG: FMN-binding protein, partial [Firmicutes bacterium]|nr:FMN-binding protein [Bacillota bacterium]